MSCNVWLSMRAVDVLARDAVCPRVHQIFGRFPPAPYSLSPPPRPHHTRSLHSATYYHCPSCILVTYIFASTKPCLYVLAKACGAWRRQVVTRPAKEQSAGCPALLASIKRQPLFLTRAPLLH